MDRLAPFQQGPIITTLIIGATCLLSILTAMQVLSPYYLTLDWYGVGRGELHRLVTGFLYSGPFGVKQALYLVQYTRYLSTLEKDTYAAKKKEMVLLLCYTWIASLIASRFIELRYGTVLFYYVLDYMYSKKHPEQPMMLVFFGQFMFPARYLFFVQIILNCFLSRSIVIPLVGVFIGHVYWFVDDVLPYLIEVDVIRLLLREKPKIQRENHNDQ